nr:kyphoscoliosis peptidase [Quercus suber]
MSQACAQFCSCFPYLQTNENGMMGWRSAREVLRYLWFVVTIVLLPSNRPSRRRGEESCRLHVRSSEVCGASTSANLRYLTLSFQTPDNTSYPGPNAIPQELANQRIHITWTLETKTLLLVITMADEEDAPMNSLQERIARLKMNQVGKIPGQAPTPSVRSASNDLPVTGRPRPPPPPRPELPARPPVPGRAQSTIPPEPSAGSSHGMANLARSVSPGFTASSNGMDGISRPSLPPRTSTQSSALSAQNPALPPRRPSASPALSPRRTSQTPSQSEYDRSRRTSTDSTSSMGTAISSISGISNTTSMTSDRAVRAPAYDPSNLPALPPKNANSKADYYASGNMKQKRAPLTSRLSAPNIAKQEGTTPPPAQWQATQTQPGVPARPARSTSRVPSIQEHSLQIEPAPQYQARTVAPPPQPARHLVRPPPKKSALAFGMNTGTAMPPPVGARPGSSQTPASASVGAGIPPPVPTGSRPDLAALQSSKPKMDGSSATNAGVPEASSMSCLTCRDFSAPDNHAARFPRQSLPRHDADWLAAQLTNPFPSATDKARAIFTWLHHNVAYDTVSFFGNTVKPSTPVGVIQSGLAVCEGYASTFAALALKAGLEAFVISGACKGYSYKAPAPGEALPPYKSTHAWNVVKLDDGKWKLIDCCWGAGHLANDKYVQKFNPERFIQSNMDFGASHFPGDTSKQFREDGRVVSYEEYMAGDKSGCGAQLFDGYLAPEGMRTASVRPAERQIVLAQQGPTVRFSFQKVCPHWDPLRNGRGPYLVYTVKAEGTKGTPYEDKPFETNGDVWWCDVPTHLLGKPGDKVWIWVLTEVGGQDARGITPQQWKTKSGPFNFNGGSNRSGVATWELA